MSSVRFICGTQDLHKELEEKLSEFFGTEDTILYSSCFDANGGLFETLLGEEDAIISDALNHASIIDGIRLCKAERHRYPNGDMAALEEALQKTQGKRLRMIATDGVFSMDGYLAKLDDICDLADKYHAMVMVDDSHASGFIGKTRPRYARALRRAEPHRRHDVDARQGPRRRRRRLHHRQEGDRRRSSASARARTSSRTRSRPRSPARRVAVLDLLSSTTALRDRLMANAARFREGVTKAGFTVKEGETPIVPVMLGDARLAQELAKGLLDEGIYVIGFSFPVVPKGEARIRVQLSAQHPRAGRPGGRGVRLGRQAPRRPEVLTPTGWPRFAQPRDALRGRAAQSRNLRTPSIPCGPQTGPDMLLIHASACNGCGVFRAGVSCATRARAFGAP